MMKLLPTRRVGPNEMVEVDHELEKRADDVTGALAEHRWRWTRDPSNPLRYTIRKYATAVGRSREIVRRYVRAYEIRRDNPMVAAADALVLARMGPRRVAAAQKVAGHHGVTVSTALQNYLHDIKEEEGRAAVSADLEQDFFMLTPSAGPNVKRIVEAAIKALKALREIPPQQLAPFAGCLRQELVESLMRLPAEEATDVQLVEAAS